MKYVQIHPVRISREFLPAGTAEIRAPVRRQAAVFRSLPDIEELPVLSVRILTGLPEPLVLIGAVVDDQVHQNKHVPLLRLRDQAFHVLHGAEPRVDRVVIRDIIPLICQRRFIDGRQPQDIHAQIFQIIQLLDNPGNISDPVPVAVVKALRVDLIGNLVMPPFAFHTHIPFHPGCPPS